MKTIVCVIFISFTLQFEVHGFIKCSHFEICQHFWSASIIVVQEIFRHYWCAGKFPALVKCRKFSSICEVQEIFLHWWSAGNFPALVKCITFMKFSSISEVQEIFRHIFMKFSSISGICTENFPAFFIFRKFSGIFVVHKTYQACNKSCAVSISHTFHSFQCIFVGHLFPHYLTSSINMCKSAGQMFLHV